MAKTRREKEEIVKDLAEKMKKAKSLIFVNFDGLKVKETEELRKKFREENIEYLVAKKTLMKLALKDAGIKDVNPKNFEKGVATVFGYDDEVAPARIIGEFSKKHEALQPIGGILENQFVNQATIIEFSKLPSRRELLAKIVGSIHAPVSGIVRVLAGNLSRFTRVLNAIKESK